MKKDTIYYTIQTTSNDKPYYIGASRYDSEDSARQAAKPRLQVGVGSEQGLIGEVHVLDGRAPTLIGVIEVLQRRVIVCGSEKLPAQIGRAHV